MAHAAKLVKDTKGDVLIRRINDEYISVVARCCDDPATDSVATLSVMTMESEDVPVSSDNPTGKIRTLRARTQAEIDALIDEHCQRTEARHAAMQAMLVGTKAHPRGQ